MKSSKYVFIVLFFLSLLAYGSSLKGSFIWDDKPLIADNSFIKDPRVLSKVFLSDLYEKTRANYYRPIFELSLAFNYSISKSDTLSYHLVNIFSHFCVTVLFYLFLYRLTRDSFISFASSLIFAIHPIHSQVVTYISGRADSLAAVFIMFALLFFSAAFTKRSYFLSLLCFALALLTKETAIMLPLILIFWGVKKALPFFAMAAVYIVMRFTILNFAAGNPFLEKKGFAVLEVGLWPRVMIFFKTLLIYFGSFFAPVRLHLERIVAYESMNLFYWLGIVIAAFLCAVLCARFKGFEKDKKKVVGFFIFWFFVWLFPQSAFIFPRIMAEHFLYLPSMSLCFFIALSVQGLKQESGKRILLVFISVYFITLGWLNNKNWQNELVFFENTVRLSPYSIRARDSLAALYLDARRYGDAEAQYRELLTYSDILEDRVQKDKAKSSCFYNLGIIFEKYSMFEEALMAYRLAVVFDPNMPQGYNNAGLVLQRFGDKEAAKEAFKKAMEVDPQYYQAYNNLAQLYAQDNRLWDAIGLWMQALAIYPDYHIAKKNVDIAQKLLTFERK